MACLGSFLVGGDEVDLFISEDTAVTAAGFVAETLG